MEKKLKDIPYYQDINDFLASFPMEERTKDPSFLCMRLKTHANDIYKPPFRRGFYFVGLITNCGKTKVTHDFTTKENLDTFLVFQSPGLVYSFLKDKDAYGYLIYFKQTCFDFFKPEFVKEFPFFDILYTNFFQLSEAKYKLLVPLFEDVFETYKKHTNNQITALKLLTLFYQLKEFSNSSQMGDRFATQQQLLLKKFIRLVNVHYIDKRKVEQYADMLSVTSSYLTKSANSIYGKTALTFINERLLAEAKSLISYTDIDIAEIAYQLNFSDPANFGKFFKKHTGVTPLEFRKSKGLL